MSKKNKKSSDPSAYGTYLTDDLELEKFGESIVEFDKQPVHLKAALYGQPGTFKTRTLATAPDLFLLDINDAGTLSIRGRGIHGRNVKTIRDVERAYWYLATKKHGFKSVGLDTLTEMLWIALREVIEDGIVPSQRNYGEAAEIVNMWITNFRNLPMHVFFICQERREDDDEDSITSPDVTPKVKSRLYPAVDLLGRMFIKEVKGKPRPVLQLGPHEYWKTKERSGILRARIVNPNLSKMVELVNSPESKLRSKKPKKN